MCVPFRANLFAAEILLFSSVYNQFRCEVGGPNATVGNYVNALATFLVTRFPKVLHCTAPDAVHFVFGSVAWEFTPEQKIQITDISCAKKDNWRLLATDVDVAAFPSRLWQMVDAERAETFPCYDLYFPVPIASGASEKGRR